MATDIGLEVRDGVALVTLDAPARRNALTEEMADQLVAACDAIDADRAIGAVVLKASGDVFCAGAHRRLIEQASRDPAAGETYDALSRIYGCIARVARLAVPSIAAVQGSAIGAGFNLALACNLRIVAVEATLSPGFTQLGLHPGGGHLALLYRAAGYETTVALGILGASVDGATAVARGLAWEAVAGEAVEARALELAAPAGRDPELSRLVVRSLALEVGPPGISLEAALDLERAAQMRTQRRLGERTPTDANDESPTQG